MPMLCASFSNLIMNEIEMKEHNMYKVINNAHKIVWLLS